MSPSRHEGYHFATEEQWKACTCKGADRVRRGPKLSLRPFEPYSPREHPSFRTVGAFAPAFTRTRETLWRDDAGMVHRLAYGDDVAVTVPAPAAIARASRMVASGDAVWVKGSAGGTLECFDLETLSRRLVVEVGGAVIDLSAHRGGGILALLERAEALRLVRVDVTGAVLQGVELPGMPRPRQMTYLRDARRVVVLSEEGADLFGISERDGSLDFHVRTASFGSCFRGLHLARDPRGRLLVAGVDDADASKTHVAVLDVSAVKLDDVALSEPPTGLAASRERLFVTAPSGLYALEARDTVPGSVTAVAAMVITPVLEAPDVADRRRWLRVEASATLPAGSSLEIAYAATDDEAERARMLELSRQPSLADARRAQALRDLDGVWSSPIVFHGGEAAANGAASFAVPLHDVQAKSLWVAVTLVAHGGAKLPELSRVSVLYPGRSLMEHLPAIYQREEASPGSFLRMLVAVLETTTQDLDARIATMASHIDPSHAPAGWLDYLARWLGLPWDDALDEEQKRCLLESAAEIAAWRGTRRGLEALLRCLLDRRRRCFRIVDATADHGFAEVGGADCPGAALPAILGGLPASSAWLDAGATLGSLRLPCPVEAHDDGTSRFVGAIRVAIAATAQEREAWEPWLARLIGEVAPVGVRVRVTWTTARALQGDRLDDALVLEGEPPPRLGTDAITGSARLPHVPAALPSSMTGSGPVLA